MSPICLDTSGWIEIAHDGANGKQFAEALTTVGPIIVSTISLYEIARYTRRVADDATTRAILEFVEQHTVTPVTREVAALAASLGSRHQLAMADALIYATALYCKATLWTQDADFEGLPRVRLFSKIIGKG